MKNKEATQISFGHKHVWTDTAGHAHHVVFDEKSLEKPRTTWAVLSVVTAVAIVAGIVGVLTAPSPKDSVYYRLSDNTLSFSFYKTIKSDPNALASVMTAGWNDEIFTVSAKGVSLYNADGDNLGFWGNSEPEQPTAAAFVSDENATTNGLLLVAYTDKIKALQFSLDRVSPGEGNSVVFTAHNGALGELTTVLTIPNANILGLACSSDRLFVADYAAERVWRYSWKKLQSLSNDPKTTPADCEIGAPDDALAYPGLRPALKCNFALSYLPSKNLVFAANSGLFRVDAFNANTGAFEKDYSWAQTSDTLHSFTGTSNPVAVAASNAWLATADAGMDASQSVSSANSPIQIFDLTGEWLGQAPYDAVERTEATYVVNLCLSPDATRIYALNSNGEIDVWTSLR